MPTNGLWIDLASAWIAAGEARLVSSAYVIQYRNGTAY